MMTANEIDSLVKKGELLPDDSSLSAYMLYYCLRGLYREYTEGIIDANIGRREKKRMIRRYEQQAFSERINDETTRRMNEISRLCVRANKENNPLAREMSELFCGIRRKANDG